MHILILRRVSPLTLRSSDPFFPSRVSASGLRAFPTLLFLHLYIPSSSTIPLAIYFCGFIIRGVPEAEDSAANDALSNMLCFCPFNLFICYTVSSCLLVHHPSFSRATPTKAKCRYSLFKYFGAVDFFIVGFDKQSYKQNVLKIIKPISIIGLFFQIIKRKFPNLIKKSVFVLPIIAAVQLQKWPTF
jgi:hypothetical protein